jgi:acetylglutamate kinase
MDKLVSKASILHEALPYIRRFRGKTFVVKYGGHAMVDEALRLSFARDVCLLRYVGIQVVVVHGGGPQINRTLSRMGIQASFSAGLRVTDDETMDVVGMVLGSVNQEIVSLICSQGGRALGLCGRDDHFIRAERMESVTAQDERGNSVQVDLGRVGTVAGVNPDLVRNLVGQEFIPVIAPIGVDAEGQALNINADTVAAHMATSLGAEKLVLLTDVDGVRDGDGELISTLSASRVEELIQEGVISGGMIPKVRCALDAVALGVQKVHVIDGRCRHALLLEIFTDQGVGTEIRRKPDQQPTA